MKTLTISIPDADFVVDGTVPADGRFLKPAEHVLIDVLNTQYGRTFAYDALTFEIPRTVLSLDEAIVIDAYYNHDVPPPDTVESNRVEVMVLATESSGMIGSFKLRYERMDISTLAPAGVLYVVSDDVLGDVQVVALIADALKIDLGFETIFLDRSPTNDAEGYTQFTLFTEDTNLLFAGLLRVYLVTPSHLAVALTNRDLQGFVYPGQYPVDVYGPAYDRVVNIPYVAPPSTPR